jgi:hypothetical protein
MLPSEDKGPFVQWASDVLKVLTKRAEVSIIEHMQGLPIFPMLAFCFCRAGEGEIVVTFAVRAFGLVEESI